MNRVGCVILILLVIFIKFVIIGNIKCIFIIIVEYGFIVLKCIYKIVYKYNKLFIKICSIRNEFLIF